jgi:hypothetical protein
MARFMDVHDGFVGVTAEQLAAAHARDLENEGAEGVHFEHAWLDPVAGKAFCLATGPSRRASCASTSAPGTPPPRSTRSRSRSNNPDGARYRLASASQPSRGRPARRS